MIRKLTAIGLVPVLFLLALACHTEDRGSYEITPSDIHSANGETKCIATDLQSYGNLLMNNKVGAAVALNPRTGKILAMVSAPDLNSGLPERYHPGADRCLHVGYQVGTVISIANELVALQDGVLTRDEAITCEKGYIYDGARKIPCHGHRPAKSLEESVMMNCVSCSMNAFRRVVDNPEFESVGIGLDHWKEQVEKLGFGHQIGAGLYEETKGYIPSSATAVKVSMGDDDFLVTPLQLANFAAIIANRGYYYPPYLTSSQEPDRHEKVECGIQPEHFDSIIDGMWRAVNSAPGSGGTAWIANVDGLDVCGNCGTAPGFGKYKHGVFIGFAPKEDPQIAIAVYVENSDFGSAVAGPIGSLMIEKYLTGKTSRPHLESRMMEANYLNLGIYKVE